MSNKTIISIKNATVKRGNNIALNNVSLNIKQGEHHAILGPNGAGKSTLLKLITRELSPIFRDDSYIYIFGEKHVNIWDLRKKIGLVSQDFQNEYQSSAKGIDVVTSAFFGSVGLFKHQLITQEQREQAKVIIIDLGLENIAESSYLQLSTGQQRRLLFARALVHQPKALILDEPTNGLDIPTRFWFIDAMRKLAQKDTTIILVTHEPHDIIPEINTVAFLKQGELVHYGNKSDLLRSELCTSVFDAEIQVVKASGYYQFLSPSLS